jgi:hypothetical protein
MHALALLRFKIKPIALDWRLPTPLQHVCASSQTAPSSFPEVLSCFTAAGAMQDQLRATKLWLQKQFKTSGIQLDPRALEQLVQAVQDVPDPEEFVHSLIDEIETGKAGNAAQQFVVTAGGRCTSVPTHSLYRCILSCHTTLPACAIAVSDERRMTPELLEQVLGALEGRSQPQDPVQVVDAFQVPHIVYDPVRKLFHKSQTQPTLQADAKVRQQSSTCSSRQPFVTDRGRSPGGNSHCRCISLLFCVLSRRWLLKVQSACWSQCLLLLLHLPLSLQAAEQGTAVHRSLPPGTAAPQAQQALPALSLLGAGRRRGTV